MAFGYHPIAAPPRQVLEECMLEQYYVQYGLNGCCLMAPWCAARAALPCE